MSRRGTPALQAAGVPVRALPLTAESEEGEADGGGDTGGWLGDTGGGRIESVAEDLEVEVAFPAAYRKEVGVVIGGVERASG